MTSLCCGDSDMLDLRCSFSQQPGGHYEGGTSATNNNLAIPIVLQC